MIAARNLTVFKMVTYKPTLSLTQTAAVGNKEDATFLSSSYYSFSTAGGADAAGASADAQAPATYTSQVRSLIQEANPDVMVNHPMPRNNTAMYIMPGHAKGGPMASIWPLPSVWSRCCTSYSAAEDSTRGDAGTAVVSRYNQDTPTGGAANGRDAEWADAATHTATNHHLKFTSIKYLPEAHEPVQGFIHAPRTAGNANNIAVAAITTKSVDNTSVVVVPAAAHHHEAYQRCQGSAPLQNDTVGGPVLINSNGKASCAPVVAATAGVVPGEFASGATETRAVAGVQLGSKWAELLAASPIVSKWVHPISYPHECSVVCGGGKQSRYLTAPSATCAPTCGSLVSQTAVLLVLLEMLLLLLLPLLLLLLLLQLMLLLLQLMQRVSDRHLLQLQLKSTQAPLH